jgi:hypothetical protein
MHQDTSIKGFLFSSMESKEEDAISNSASKPERKPAKQADPWKVVSFMVQDPYYALGHINKGSILLSMESKEEDAVSTTASKPEKKPAKQADPW